MTETERNEIDVLADKYSKSRDLEVRDLCLEKLTPVISTYVEGKNLKSEQNVVLDLLVDAVCLLEKYKSEGKPFTDLFMILMENYKMPVKKVV